MRNYLTFDNKDSLDFGVYINGQGTFRAPARSYNVLNIPGRNGDLLGFGSKLENVEITYRAFIYTNFDANIAALRSFLLSHVGYFKLTDSYHPDEYRLAYYKGPFVPDVVANNGAGSFDLTFVCKPQRFLNSGEEVTTLTPAGAEQHTYQGEIVNFSTLAGDKITSALADFHPIQDLHGYASPWPAGGGVNVLDGNIKWTAGTYHGLQLSTQNGYEYTLTGTATEGGTIITNLIALEDAVILPPGTYIGNAGAYELRDAAGNFLKNQYGGTPFTRNESFYVRRVYLEIVSGRTYNSTNFIGLAKGSTALTEWSPYSNICPISGRTGLSVYRTGKNLLNGTDFRTYSSWDDVAPYGTYKTQAGTLGYKLPVADGTTYTISFGITADSFPTYLYLCRGNGTDTTELVQRFTAGGSDPVYATEKTFTAESGWMYFIRLYTNNSTFFDGQIEKIESEQLELGSTPTTYEPYNGNTYAVDWTTEAGTVYGGTLDVVTGVLTIDRAMVDLGTLTYSVWNKNSSRDCYSLTIQDIRPRRDAGDNLPAISSIFVSTNYNATWKPWQMSYTNQSKQVVFMTPHDEYADADAFKAAMSGVQLVYELATPITYQLTAQEIEALADNYIWSDVGQVTVTVTDAMTIENPTLFDAKPLLRVYGAGTLTLGGQTITISTADVYTDIDCEMMDCFKDTVSKNGNVSFSGYDFPVIPPGRNVITMDGVTQVDITPRWWAA